MSELKSSANALFNSLPNFYLVRSLQKQFTATWQEVNLGRFLRDRAVYSEVMKSREIPCWLFHQPDLYHRQVAEWDLRNLVDNANKNTNKDKTGGQHRGDTIEIEISDSSIGMDEAEIWHSSTMAHACLPWRPGKDTDQRHAGHDQR